MSARAAAAELRRRGLMLVLSSPSGAGKTTLVAPAARRAIRRSALGLRDDAHAAAERDRGRRLSFHRRRASSPSMMRARRVARMRRGVRPLLRHAARAGRGGARGRAATCCSTSTGRARSSCRKRWRDDVVRVFMLPPSAEELRARLIGAPRIRRDDRGQAAWPRPRTRSATGRNMTTSSSTATSTMPIATSTPSCGRAPAAAPRAPA